MAPVVDYGNITERDFTPVARGWYRAQFVGAPLKNEDADASADKYPYHNAEFKGVGGEDDAFNNKHVWDVWSLSPKALFKFKGAALALGANPEDFVPGSGIATEDTIASIEGAEVELLLDIESYMSNETDPDTGERIRKNKNVIKDYRAVR